MSTESNLDAAILMDRMYRYQRYIYDITRKPYLLGRDQMIEGLKPPAGASILEIGCGTGRNLIKAAQTYPRTIGFGLDVSAEMLETARASIQRNGMGTRIKIALADATDFDPIALFLRAKFDRVFISYSLSMIPVWQQVLAESAKKISAGGSLHIVDFGQCEGLPKWAKALLCGWLRQFDVFPRADLAKVAAQIAQTEGLHMSVTHPLKGYAVLIVLSR